MKEFLQYTIRFRQMYQRSFQALGEELGLSQMEMDILLFLHNNPERNTARDIAACRGFARSNVSKGVEHLEQLGWLRVEPDPDSRRMKRLFFCPERLEDTDRLYQCQRRCLNRVFEGFTQEDLDQFAALLARTDGNIRKALKDQQGGRF